MKIRYIKPTVFKNLELIRESKKALVYRGINEESGYVFKFFKMNEGYLKSEQKNIENKIMDAKKIESVPEIVVPSYGLYSEVNNDQFIGYQMEEINGPQFREYIVDENIQMDLYKFADEFYELENILERGNKEGCIFPDIATLTNIMVSIENNHTQKYLIDYEGIQVDKYYTSGISQGINPYLLKLEKYYKDKKRLLYSKNLDYASILHMYLRVVLHVNLNYMGRKSKITGKVYTLNDIFSTVKLTNYDFMQKVWKLFVPNVENEKVGDLFYQIAEEYKLRSYTKGEIEFRYLVKK